MTFSIVDAPAAFFIARATDRAISIVTAIVAGWVALYASTVHTFFAAAFVISNASTARQRLMVHAIIGLITDGVSGVATRLRWCTNW